MPPHIEKSVLKGTVTVAYDRRGGEWYATALQFDLMGYGKTKTEAFEMLQELVSEYLHEIVRLLREKKKVKFFNPSDEKSWNSAECEDYRVRFSLLTSAPRIKKRVNLQGLESIIEFIDSLDAVELVRV